MAEVLICGAIAFAMILVFGLVSAFCVWLEINKGIAVEIGISIITIFILLTFVVWHFRNGTMESKETKLERRRI